MTEPIRLSDSLFGLELPNGFTSRQEEQGWQCVCTDPPGVIHFTPEVVDDPDELPNLSRMLSGFLTRSGQPVAPYDLLKITSIPDTHGFSWQYTQEENYHRVWLFGNDHCWLLVTFVCPAPVYRTFHEPLTKSIATLRLRSDGNDI